MMDFKMTPSRAIGNYKTINSLSLITVLALFPGFFFYNSGLSFGMFPDIFGGGFSLIAVALGVPLLTLQLSAFPQRNTRIIWMDVFLFILVSYMIIWAVINCAWGDDYQHNIVLLQEVLLTISLWLVLYVAFRNLRIENGTLILALSISLIAMLAVSLVNAQGQMYYAAQLTTNEVRVASYQAFARSALVTSLLLLSVSSGMRMALLIISSLVLLFLLGARSEFVGFVMAGTLILYARESTSRVILLWVPFIICVLTYLTLTTDVLSGDSRILQLFDLSDSTSYLRRDAMQAYAVKVISSNWLLGNYGARLDFSDMGSYSHNALSAWVDFGLIGFLLFSGINSIVFFSSARSLIRAKKKIVTPIISFQFAISAYCVLVMVAAKVVYDPIFAVSWGSYAAAKLADSRR